MGNWLDKTGLTQIRNILATKFGTKVDKHPGGPAGKYLQTNSDGDAVWGDAASPEAVSAATKEWLEDNVSGGQTIAVDNSLLTPGAAADAKAAGDLIISSDTAPSASTNKLWIKRTPQSEVSVPTMDEFNGVKSALMYGKIDCLESAVWENGTIVSGGIDDSDGKRIRTRGYIDIAGCTKVSFNIDQGYKFGWHLYRSDKSSYSDASAFITNDYDLDIPSEVKYLRINMGDIDNNTSNLSWADHIQAFVYKYGMLKKVDENKTDVLNMMGELDHVIKLSDSALGSDWTWEKGSIKSNGDNKSSNTVIRTIGYINIDGYEEIDFTIANGYKFGWHLYNVNKEHELSASDYITGSTVLYIPSNAKYMRINITTSEGTASSDITWAENLQTKGKLRIVDVVTTIEKDNIGVGEYSYTGEKINLTPIQTRRKCTFNTWVSFNSVDYQDLANYYLSDNQSVALFGDYVFFFNGNNTITVLDYETKQFVGVITTPVTSRNHQNAAQFSDIYYDTNDDFPLLFVSRCGNTTSAGLEDTCLIYRIQNINNVFSATLINTIDSDISTLGNDWCIDNVNKTIYMLGYVNASYQTSTNNPIKFYKWHLPNKEDIVSGNTITLQKSNCIAQSEMPYVLLQSAFCISGMLYITCRIDGVWKVVGYDMQRGIVTATLALQSSKECEGVNVYDGKMYITQYGSNSTTNPLVVYEVAY